MDSSLHRPWFDVVGDRPCLTKHIVVLHDLLEEVNTETVVMDLFVATFATESLLHFGGAVEQLEVRSGKELALLVLSLADDYFEEVEQAGEVDRQDQLLTLFEGLQKGLFHGLVGHCFRKVDENNVIAMFVS